MRFEDFMHLAALAFEVAGVAVLVIGSVAAGAIALREVSRGAPAFATLRRRLGRTILLGLEILIVADIILTITIDLTPESAITLGIIVLVRTFLSFSLEIELEGVVPWRRAAVEARAADHQDEA